MKFKIGDIVTDGHFKVKITGFKLNDYTIEVLNEIPERRSQLYTIVNLDRDMELVKKLQFEKELAQVLNNDTDE